MQRGVEFPPFRAGSQHNLLDQGAQILRRSLPLFLAVGRLIWNRLRYLKDPSTGKRVSRLNPESEWIVKDVPDLRIVDDELWQAVRARQGEIAEKFANVTEAVRAHHKKNRLNGARRPKSLLSGLVFCGCCGGPYSLRGADRFACSNHISKGSCSNSRGIAREDLERRVLAGLKDRMMAPEIVEDAMRAHAEETNRLNRERRSNGDSWKAELVKVEKQIGRIVEAIADGMYHPSMKEKMMGLEARREELTTLLANAPADTPDILPSASAIYAKKIVALTKALNVKLVVHEARAALHMAANGGVAPEPSFGAGDAFLVECAGNGARADACGKLAEDAPHHIGLGCVELAVAPDRIIGRLFQNSMALQRTVPLFFARTNLRKLASIFANSLGGMKQ